MTRVNRERAYQVVHVSETANEWLTSLAIAYSQFIWTLPSSNNTYDVS